MQNIEQYTLNYIRKYWSIYQEYVDNNDDHDIDFPGYKFKFKNK